MRALFVKQCSVVKFIYSEKATKFRKIFPLLFTPMQCQSKGKISQNFVAFSEYMNFIISYLCTLGCVYFFPTAKFSRIMKSLLKGNAFESDELSSFITRVNFARLFEV